MKRNLTRLILPSCLLSLFAAGPSVVRAADAQTSPVTVQVAPGKRTVSVGSNLRFGPMEIKSLYPSASEHKVNFLLNSGLSFPVSVDDYTGTQAGWQLRASMTGFSVPNAPAATDLTGGLYFSNPDVTGEIPETLATGNALTTIRTGANGHEYGPQVPILSAAPGKGMGHNTADFALPDVRLLLAFNVLARPQRYSATILWTLADTPTAVGV